MPKRRFTPAEYLQEHTDCNDDKKFSVYDFVGGLEFHNSRRSIGFTKHRDFWERHKAKHAEHCEEHTPSDVLNHSMVKYGAMYDPRLHPVIDDFREAMPYLQPFPVDVSSHELGSEGVVFIHKDGEFPVGKITYEKWEHRYAVFSPLLKQHKNGYRYTADTEKVFSIAKSYFKYHAPAKTTEFVALNYARKSGIFKAFDHCLYEYEKLDDSMRRFSRNDEVANEVFDLVKELKDSGHQFSAALESLLNQHSHYKKARDEYAQLADTLMYARLKDSKVHFSFCKPSNGRWVDIRYNKITPSLTMDIDDMPVEFVVKLSQIAMEEKTHFADKIGIQLNNYEYVLYADGMEADFIDFIDALDS
jgi:hypothetical protein